MGTNRDSKIHARVRCFDSPLRKSAELSPILPVEAYCPAVDQHTWTRSGFVTR